MSAFVDALLTELDDASLAELADRLAPLLQSRLGQPAASDRWLNSDEAAEYIGAPRSRVHDLVGLGHLQPHRDGRRLLFRRSDLDAYLVADG